MAKSALAGDLFDPTLMDRCVINQELTLHYVSALLAKEDEGNGKEREAQLQTCFA